MHWRNPGKVFTNIIFCDENDDSLKRSTWVEGGGKGRKGMITVPMLDGASYGLIIIKHVLVGLKPPILLKKFVSNRIGMPRASHQFFITVVNLGLILPFNLEKWLANSRRCNIVSQHLHYIKMCYIIQVEISCNCASHCSFADFC